MEEEIKMRRRRVRQQSGSSRGRLQVSPEIRKVADRTNTIKGKQPGLDSRTQFKLQQR